MTDVIFTRTRTKPVELPQGDTAVRSGKKWPALPVFLYLLFIALPFMFDIGTLSMTFLRVILLVMIIPLYVRLALGKYGRVNLVDILFFLYIIWAGLCLQINNPDRAVEFLGSNALDFLGGYMLTRAYIRNREEYIAFQRMLIVMVVCTVPFAIYEAITATAPITEIINKIPGFKSHPDFWNIINERRMGIMRTQVIFQHPIHYGLFCSTIFALAYVGTKGIYSDTKRIFICCAIGLGVVLSVSSAPLLGIAFQCGLIAWALIFRDVPRRWLILTTLFVVCYVVVDLLSNRTPIKVLISYLTFSAHSGYWRVLIFEWGVVNVINNPIFGIGLNDWVRPSWMHDDSVDNFWLLNAMRYGIPGLILISVPYFYALFRIGLRNFDGDRELWLLRRGWVMSFAGMTFALCTVHIWETVYSFTFLLFGAGMWMMTAKPKGSVDKPLRDNSGYHRANTPQTDVSRADHGYSRHAGGKTADNPVTTRASETPFARKNLKNTARKQR
ncbi:hypothetical protein GCM10008927_10780 [Amylibacter ulvae]|uniref:O-antigen ligase-related domain-containing protein n=1 Tax=Paramylibacter ulvae TaxID=1651968 RepID=A0ABQ3CWR6_9RHOB|nr:O-antigen ligase family protein [Amylibacter ulvae]GHA47704.1 hypothetical protein GCM10008927_10780 [Amylibacter ulvae]